jgi:hypothetical protein
MGFRRKMRDDLMTVEIEIDPLVRAAAFATTEQAAVERTRRSEIVDGKCKVEGRQAHGSALSLRAERRNPALHLWIASSLRSSQ